MKTIASDCATELVLITGLSGSGKSVALAVLEDSGYYCVDNFPGAMFDSLIDTVVIAGHKRVALTMDARSGEDITDFAAHVASLRARGIAAGAGGIHGAAGHQLLAAQLRQPLELRLDKVLRFRAEPTSQFQTRLLSPRKLSQSKERIHEIMQPFLFG